MARLEQVAGAAVRPTQTTEGVRFRHWLPKRRSGRDEAVAGKQARKGWRRRTHSFKMNFAGLAAFSAASSSAMSAAGVGSLSKRVVGRLPALLAARTMSIDDASGTRADAPAVTLEAQEWEEEEQARVPVERELNVTARRPCERESCLDAR